MVTPELTDARAGGACEVDWTWLSANDQGREAVMLVGRGMPTWGRPGEARKTAARWHGCHTNFTESRSWRVRSPPDPRAVCMRPSRDPWCVFIIAVPVITLFAWGEGDS
jgi:hypothetical protein